MGGEFTSSLVLGSRNMADAAQNYGFGAIPTPVQATQTNPLPAFDFNALRVALGSIDNGNTLPLSRLFSSDGHLTQFGVNFLNQRAGFSGLTIATTAHDLGARTLTDTAPGIHGNITDAMKIIEYAATHGGSYTSITLAQVQSYGGGSALTGNAASDYFNDITGLLTAVCKEDPSCTQITTIADARVAAEHQLTLDAQEAHNQFVRQVGHHINTGVCTESATRANSADCVRLVETAVSDRKTAQRDLTNERTNGQTITILGQPTRPSLQTIVAHKDDWTYPQALRVGGEVLTSVGLLGALFVASRRKAASVAVFDARLKPYLPHLQKTVETHLNKLSKVKTDDTHDHPHLKENLQGQINELVAALCDEWKAIARDQKTSPLRATVDKAASTLIVGKGGIFTTHGIEALLKGVLDSETYETTVRDNAKLVLDSLTHIPAAPKAAEARPARKMKVSLDKDKTLKFLESILSGFDDPVYVTDYETLVSQLANGKLKRTTASNELTREEFLKMLTNASDDVRADWQIYLDALEKDSKDQSDKKHDDSKKTPDPAPVKSDEEKAKDALKNYIEDAFNELQATPELTGLTLDDVVNELFKYNSSTSKLDLSDDTAILNLMKDYKDNGTNDKIKTAVANLRIKIINMKVASGRTTSQLKPK